MATAAAAEGPRNPDAWRPDPGSPKPGGRPRKSEADLRSAKVGLRFRPAEAAAIRSAADRRKLSSVEFIRRAAVAAAGPKGGAGVDQVLVVEERIAARGALIAATSNLADLVRAARGFPRSRAATDGSPLQELAQDVADRIKELLPRLEAELDHLRNTVKELFR